MVALDTMHQLDRLAFGGDQIKPATAGEAVGGQSQDAVGDGIAMMMVVKEPALVVAVAQGSLDVGEVHAGSIVNQRGMLRWVRSIRLPAKASQPRICTDSHGSSFLLQDPC